MLFGTSWLLHQPQVLDGTLWDGCKLLEPCGSMKASLSSVSLTETVVACDPRGRRRGSAWLDVPKVVFDSGLCGLCGVGSLLKVAAGRQLDIRQE